ncbi:AAA family ATPase [Anaerosolibacter sp.]|uniref:AAA family ATPase n=1 Tax=Anaerosolibacter sp. TaxID=1872527 RepID=UPI0039F03432
MGKVIVFRGKAGVGKTTISNEAGKKLNIPIIRKDDIYDSIATYIINHENRNKACYDTLHKILESNILNGLDVIVDAGFHYLDQILQFKSWILHKNAIFVPILCICSDEDIWAERFNKRSLNPQPNNL